MIVTDVSILHQISKPISIEEQEKVFEELETEIKRHPNAVGLSAPQIGYQLRAFIYYHKDFNDQTTIQRVANPQVLTLEPPLVDSAEGCVSVPNVFCLMKRFSECHVKDDLDGEYVLTGGDAIVFQHELDHLDGVLITDDGIRIPKDIGRNDPCYCGSNKKFKKCHGK